MSLVYQVKTSCFFSTHQTSESRTTGTTETYNIGYTYDKNGNRTGLAATGQHMQPAASVSYTYTGNKLASFSKAGVAQSFSHTGNGELNYGTTPTYDNGARRKVDRLSSTNYYYSNYNHKNERSFRDNVLNSAVATMTQYVYDESSHLISEYDKNGVLVEYVWLGDKPIAAIYGSGAATKIYYIVTDAQNTPRRLIDSSNHAIVWAWDSTAFGLGNPTGTVTFNLRFPGQYYDAGTDQFYNHNRYYNPELGRYMEPDPIGLEGGLNPYAYAGSNPVMNVDPRGLIYGFNDVMNYSINNTLAFNSIDMSHLNGWQMSFESAASNFISNSSFTFGNKPVGALAYENYQVGSFRENMAHIGNVGPLDAIKAKNIAKESLSNAQNSGLSGVHNGAADAYRHCQWSCEMGKQLGVDQASKIGGTHESYSKGPVNEIYMDTYNNALGRQMSLRPEGCKVNCMKLVEKGVLFQLEIAKPKKR